MARSLLLLSLSPFYHFFLLFAFNFFFLQTTRLFFTLFSWLNSYFIYRFYYTHKAYKLNDGFFKIFLRNFYYLWHFYVKLTSHFYHKENMLQRKSQTKDLFYVITRRKVKNGKHSCIWKVVVNRKRSRYCFSIGGG